MDRIAVEQGHGRFWTSRGALLVKDKASRQRRGAGEGVNGQANFAIAPTEGFLLKCVLTGQGLVSERATEWVLCRHLLAEDDHGNSHPQP